MHKKLALGRPLLLTVNVLRLQRQTIEIIGIALQRLSHGDGQVPMSAVVADVGPYSSGSVGVCAIVGGRIIGPLLELRGSLENPCARFLLDQCVCVLRIVEIGEDALVAAARRWLLPAELGNEKLIVGR